MDRGRVLWLEGDGIESDDELFVSGSDDEAAAWCGGGSQICSSDDVFADDVCLLLDG